MAVVKVVGFFFRTYRVVISPALQLGFGIQCRYQESCSAYAERMFCEKGFLKGLIFTVRRLRECNQYSGIFKEFT